MRNVLCILFFILGCHVLISTSAGAQSISEHTTKPETFLPADKAFVLQTFSNKQEIQLHWHIAQGYYLYKEMIHLRLVHVHSNQTHEITPDLPEGKIVQDPYFGEQVVYESQLQITLNQQPLTTDERIELHVHYQGCAAQGLCYPPMIKKLNFEWLNQQWTLSTPANDEGRLSPTLVLATQTASNPTNAIHIAQNNASLPARSTLTQSTPDYFHAPLWQVLLSFLGFGILLSFTPCVLPMLPILSSVLIGQQQKSAKRGFLLSLTYTLSMAFVLSLLGITAVALGKNFTIFMQQPIVIALFTGLFIYLGLVQLGIGKLHLPNNLQDKVHQWQRKLPMGSYINAIIMGGLATLIATPCVSAPLIGALSYIAQTGNYWLGASALCALGIGMGVILVVAGTAGSHYLPKAGAWMHAVNRFFASLFFALSIWLLGRIIPLSYQFILWALWCLMNAYWLGTFSKLQELPSRMGVLFLLSAIGLTWLTSQGEHQPLQRFKQFLQPAASVHADTSVRFQAISSLEELQAHFSRQNSSPTLIKAYADWCTTCRHNESVVFSNPTVQQSLQGWQLLTIDMTKLDQHRQALVQRLDIYGPPMLLFFNPDGEEVTQDRMIGKIAVNAFLTTLDKHHQKQHLPYGKQASNEKTMD